MAIHDHTNPVLVELTRGDIVESFHRGAVAVCGTDGGLRWQIGDVERPIYPRSAFKMIQALPLLETGAADAFGLTPQELALACASHSGEPVHVETVARSLARIGAAERDLACGPHLPLGEAAAHALLHDHQKPTRLHNNCSGKHAGFLCTARHCGEPLAGYADLDHPVQRRVRQAIGELCQVAPDAMPWGIDGCTAPNFALPLRRLAQGMARLANPAGLGAIREQAIRRLVEAVKAHPHLVAGTGRADVDLITEATGGTVTKTGAEGVFTAAIPSLGLGVALKIDDGAGRAAETAIAAILVALGVLDPRSRAARASIDAPIRNWRGDICGTRRPTVVLSRQIA